jgi:hypothetical protein
MTYVQLVLMLQGSPFTVRYSTLEYCTPRIPVVRGYMGDGDRIFERAHLEGDRHGPTVGSSWATSCHQYSKARTRKARRQAERQALRPHLIRR